MVTNKTWPVKSHRNLPSPGVIRFRFDFIWEIQLKIFYVHPCPDTSAIHTHRLPCRQKVVWSQESLNLNQALWSNWRNNMCQRQNLPSCPSAEFPFFSSQPHARDLSQPFFCLSPSASPFSLLFLSCPSLPFCSSSSCVFPPEHVCQRPIKNQNARLKQIDFFLDECRQTSQMDWGSTCTKQVILDILGFSKWLCFPSISAISKSTKVLC